MYIPSVHAEERNSGRLGKGPGEETITLFTLGLRIRNWIKPIINPVDSNPHPDVN